MRVAIVGPGKMGRAVADLAVRDGDEVIAMLGVGALSPAAVAGAEVAFEFTTPAAAPENLIALAASGVPTVCGTTAWYDALPRVEAAVLDAGGALLYAPNFSLGVHLMVRLAREAAAFLADRPEFDAHILETHHRAKKDAPSGTAQLLRDTLRAVDPSREFPVTSVRAGEVPGTHVVTLEGTAESVTIEHRARDRTVFARGALVAARWLIAQPRTGVYTMHDVLGDPA